MASENSLPTTSPLGSSSTSSARPSASATRRSSILQHAPARPSNLRISHEPPPSPEKSRSLPHYEPSASGRQDDSDEVPHSPGSPRSMTSSDGQHHNDWPQSAREPVKSPKTPAARGSIDEHLYSDEEEASEETALLEAFSGNRPQDPGPAQRLASKSATFPQPKRPSMRPHGSVASSYSSYRQDFGGRGVLSPTTIEEDPKSGNKTQKPLSTTSWLARTHGIKNQRLMYLFYYIPFFQWISQYQRSYLLGDFVAGLTMASFYLPMSLSYATNLGHIPPINGLYSFAIQPILYAIFGSCPQMVVGPEAAGSLLIGTIVTHSVDSGHIGEDDGLMNARVAGVATAIAGMVTLLAGLFRLGFLDSVLSRPLLRSFITGIGFVIVVDQLIQEMGLSALAKDTAGVVHGSTLDKFRFLMQNIGNAHKLTTAVAAGSFVIIMVFRTAKRRLQPGIPWVAYIPDRFLVVLFSAILTWSFAWDEQGLEILGDVHSPTAHPFPPQIPLQVDHMVHIRQAMSTAFLIAILGFFESSVAAKSLGTGADKGGLKGISLSANRELVALGVANVMGGCFMALPAFGGYGRSKVNESTGGKTPMSSFVLSGLAFLCVYFLLPYFYYLPKAVLSSMITVVAYSLIEEAPHDIAFFVHIRAYPELLLMILIFVSTILYSLSLGISIGVILSVIVVIRNATRPRIQIMGRVPGTSDFENAEENPEHLEFVEGCLIVKIPEPLTFANTGDLRGRLRRLELYGTTAAHPALPRVRAEVHNSNVIFDVHGVTELDGSGAQVLKEIVEGYRARGVRVFFCRVPKQGSKVWLLMERSGIIEAAGGRRNFVNKVESALKMSEIEGEEEEERWDEIGRLEEGAMGEL